MVSTPSGAGQDPPLVAIVPFSDDYLGGALFRTGGDLDRDASLAPWRALHDALAGRGWAVQTIDQVGPRSPAACLHLDSFGPPPSSVDPGRTVLVMWEPEVVAPYWYRRARSGRLPFPIVYTNSIRLVESGEPFRYLHWPQPLMDSGRPPSPRSKWLVMINGRKYPVQRGGELYSARERVAAWFARRGRIEIYGRGWSTLSPRHPVAALRTPALRRAHRGLVESKFDVLCASRFALCFENMREPGYHTEKLFDVLAAGAVPIYLGDPLIDRVVGRDAFVDYAALGRPRLLHDHLEGLQEDALERMRDAGREALSSDRFAPYRVGSFAQRIATDVEAVAARV